MRYVNLPGINLKVSSLCLGTMMFGGQTNEADSLQIMDYAYEQGINFFDTANMYNQGESEKIVGKGLKGRRDEIILATKVFNKMGTNPNDAGLSRRNILASVEASLKRLDTDYIDIYYMHAPTTKPAWKNRWRPCPAWSKPEKSVISESAITRPGKSPIFWLSATSAAMCRRL